MAVNLHATHYRFGIDELAESTHGWRAAEDANPAAGSVPVDTPFLLRFTVQDTGGTAAGNVDNRFQVKKNAGAFQDITTTSTVVKAVAAAALTNGGNCTKRLSGTGTFESTGAGQTETGLSGGNANDIAASGNSETECGLQIVSADVADTDVLTFRLTSPDFTITNDVVPTLTVAELRSGSGVVNAVGTLAGVGQVTTSGTGSVLAVGTLTGAGQVTNSGSGSILAVAALAGDGETPAGAVPEGSGSITAVASLTGAGQVTMSGSGGIGAVASLAGVGQVESGGGGSVAAVGSLGGVGQMVPAGTGSISVVAALAGVGQVDMAGAGSITAVAGLVGVGPTAEYESKCRRMRSRGRGRGSRGRRG